MKINIVSVKLRNGFTLVELIVVIAILAILWTIAFLSLQWYSKDARDSVRVSDMKNIETWLELFSIKSWRYPEPDNATSYSWWTTEVFKQWLFWDNVTRAININLTPLDPKTETKYVYSVSKGWSYYQLWADKENSQSSIVNTSYADSITTSIVKGNYKLDPSLPSLIVVPSNITSSWVFNPNVCFVVDWGKNSLNNCVEKKKDMILKDYDNSLVGYWDMETLSWSMLKDLSGNGNDWIFSWAILPTSTWWNVWKALYFSGSEIIVENKIFEKFKFSKWISILWIAKSFSWSSICSLFWSEWNVNLLLNDLVVPTKLRMWDTLWNWKNDNFIINSSLNSFYWWILDLKLWLDIWKIVKIFNNWTLINDVVYNWVFSWLNETSSWNISFIWTRPIPWNNCKWVIDEIKIYNRVLSDKEIYQQAKVIGF